MRRITRERSTHLLSRAAQLAILLLGIDIVVTTLLTRPRQEIIYSDVLSPIIGMLSCVALTLAAIRSALRSRRLAIAWGLIAFSMVAVTIGDISWAVLELALGEPPFPSIADAFYISYYPLLLAGVLLLPETPASGGEQIKRMLDAGIVMMAAILGFWNFLLGPIIVSNAGFSLSEQIILLAYPVGDLLLFWALLRIIYRKPDHDQENELPVFLLAGGLTLNIVADCIYTYQALSGTYVSGGILDVSWRATGLMAGLAGIAQVATVQSFGRTSKSARRSEFFIQRMKAIAPYISYLWLIAAYILLIQSRFTPFPMDFLALSLGVGCTIGLVLLRQIITLNEVTRRQAVEEQLTHDKLHDSMTRLPNRVLFLDRLGQAIEFCRRRTEYTAAVLFVDIDHFKVINDSLGHLVGDQLLIAAGKRMKESLRASDTVARLGGDEFAILLEITREKNSASAIAEKILESLKFPFKLEGHEPYITASIGIVSDVFGYDSPEEVLRDADIAMYQAKAAGKARFEIFNLAMRSQVFSRLELEQQLRAALENNEFQLYYQPILSMESNEVVSFEALIRWRHPRRGLLLPGEFLFIAEESGLILPIGKWVLNEACAQLGEWHRKYPNFRHVSINVNIATRQFSQPGFISEVAEALRTSNLEPKSLKLEITEGVLIRNYTAANEVFTKLQELGIQLQIDDFGSGYSALGYLQHFPISAVKIDKSFVEELGIGQRSTALIRAMISMARELGIDTIAEGIETGEQFDQLRRLYCNFGQGFLLSKPLDEEAAEKILAREAHG